MTGWVHRINQGWVQRPTERAGATGGNSERGQQPTNERPMGRVGGGTLEWWVQQGTRSRADEAAGLGSAGDRIGRPHRIRKGHVSESG